MPEHRACPCCGGKPKAQLELSYPEWGHYRYWVVCLKCLLRTTMYKTKAEAWAAWDQRYTPPTSAPSAIAPIKVTPKTTPNNKKGLTVVG